VTFSDQSTAIPGASGEASEKQDWSIMGEFDQDWTKAAEAQTGFGPEGIRHGR